MVHQIEKCWDLQEEWDNRADLTRYRSDSPSDDGGDLFSEHRLLRLSVSYVSRARDRQRYPLPHG